MLRGLKNKKVFIFAGITLVFILSTILFLLLSNHILLFIATKNIHTTELVEIYRYTPSILTRNTLPLAFKKDYSPYVKGKLLVAVSEVYSERKLQELEPFFLKSLDSNNLKLKHIALLIYCNEKLPLSDGAAEKIWSIFKNTDENIELRELAGLFLANKFHKNEKKSKIIVDIFEELGGKANLMYKMTLKNNGKIQK